MLSSSSLVDRIARVRVLQHLLHRGRGRERDRQRDDVGARHHDVLDGRVREVEDLVDHLLLVGLEHAAALALAQRASAARPRCARPPSRRSCWMPSMRMTSWASQSRNVMNQLKVKKKTRIGTATASATGSARGSVYDFGTISPITTCRIEITRNATITETAVATPLETPPTALSITRATAGSPSAPSASDESVMPSCMAEMKCEGSLTILRTVRARRLPSLDELVEARVPHRDEGVLGRDEERVPEHAEDDQHELESSHGAHARAPRPRRCPSTQTATRFICLPGGGAALICRSRRLLERDRPDEVTWAGA